ncbi:ankyrin repeat domain-containing protein [Brenneria izbisi]|uniref:Ankyrin repeat domain-containing protein n=1 Tax=Brenneria izbisi TaxID=2939450 RepID=A0AA42C1I2_9GAMM|nr:ankyrin repeat domain-containing protein [Brenneria izbisi]MCV9877433.1 ankyrin repeat domain-containing protein [Brenneria izbisi]MCV9881001.1 ankyrin repeat domain-containing protein [Brenneria izbisi]
MKSLLLTLCLLATGFSVAQAAEKIQNERALKQSLDTYLWNAAREGDLTILDTFITAKYNLNVADEKGYTAVILAAYHGHDAAVEKLLQAGADPCLRDKRGNSALMGAVFKGEVKIARRLIAAECNPDERNNAGQTAAMFASLFQREELLNALKAKGADMQAVDVNGNSVQRLKKGEFVTH